MHSVVQTAAQPKGCARRKRPDPLGAVGGQGFAEARRMISAQLLAVFVSMTPHSARLLVQDGAAGPGAEAPAPAPEAPPAVEEERREPPVRRAYTPDFARPDEVSRRGARLLETRQKLLDSKPGVGLPIGMFIGSAGAGAASALLISQLAPLLPNLRFGNGYASIISGFVLFAFIIGVAAGLAHLVMAIVGINAMASRLRERGEIDDEVAAIDREIREVEARLVQPPR
jgi:hypothetical protein